ncbi:hypothetical protein QZH56_12215 [Streptomyces olivoreticuli]|uniref:Uncharacterized protein n=1 Tax=Streptomyces blastmyceticus TaxID=68180 RepID=A0ABN0WFY1_9ACTN|nr:hypothetical protein [Streptomyces olivoreticuli]WKK26284.1 hypothetical protein QZH56_12215 [Streptomyces olivoreticuli]
MSVASPEGVETFETRTPDADGWRGIPFRHPADMQASDGGRHDGGSMPPEAPRDPQPQGGDGGK